MKMFFIRVVCNDARRFRGRTSDKAGCAQDNREFERVPETHFAWPVALRVRGRGSNIGGARGGGEGETGELENLMEEGERKRIGEDGMWEGDG